MWTVFRRHPWAAEILSMTRPQVVLRSGRGGAAPTTVDPGRAGLVLSPSIFGWPKSWADTRPTGAGIVRYPARGLATVWAAREPAPDALAGLIGRTRASLLDLLGAPATTAELAARLGVTSGAVSQHLTVLRAAGLASTRRAGRAVLHLRTARADALLPGSADFAG
jgi:DNA-binding transcriptional ArsR family regulator